MTTQTSEDRPHVVIVGGGFAGLAVAQGLGGKPIRVTLVDRTNHHLFVPLLYQVATAALSPADIAEPIRRILSRHRNIEVILDEVTGVDTGERQVRLWSGRRLSYDRLVLATGSTYSYFGHDEWAQVAPGLKTVEDARAVRTRLLLAFERAETTTDPLERQRLMTVLIVGGGPTGVEMAGAVAELARFTLARDFRRIDPRQARIILVEAGPRLLAGFPQRLSDYVRRQLDLKGVEVRLGEAVESLDANGAVVAGERIEAATLVWGAGVRASPAAQWLGVATDRGGRILVAPDLSVPGAPHVYALGDTALSNDNDGRPLPGLAQVAQQQGRHLGPALAANLLEGRPIPPFRFQNRGNTAIVGRNAAVFDFGRRQLTGWPAWILWAIIHVYLLVGFQKRLLVTVQWLWRYLTYQRGARLITVTAPAKPAQGQVEASHSIAKRG